MFQVDLDNYQRIKFAFMYHMHIPGAEVESWPYWEYETQTEILADVIKKRNQQEQQNQKEAQGSSSDHGRQAQSFLQKAQSTMPKMPSPGSFKMPKMP